ncbi:MAG: outer membrane beta-barrel protein [Bacteroidales bacterium]|nr:outer membrane beta-barrel protein [Bacteroidales bacterium]
MRKYCIFLLFLLFLSPVLQAQKTGDLGVFGGVGYYMGDLNPRKLFLTPKPAYGALYRYNLNHRLALQMHYIHGKVEASDAKSKTDLSRNLNFSSTIDEAGVQFEVNFLEYFIGSKLHWWTPYIFGGTSVFFYKPYGNVNGSNVELQPLHTEGQGTSAYPERKPYNLYAFSMPFGVGVKMSINKYLGIGAEWGMRKTTTDYLDDVSQSYYLNLVGANPAQVSPAGYASDPSLSHNAGMKRGNTKDKDWYSFAGITMVVKIRMLGKERCLDHQREGY